MYLIRKHKYMQPVLDRERFLSHRKNQTWFSCEGLGWKKALQYGSWCHQAVVIGLPLNAIFMDEAGSNSSAKIKGILFLRALIWEIFGNVFFDMHHPSRTFFAWKFLSLLRFLELMWLILKTMCCLFCWCEDCTAAMVLFSVYVFETWESSFHLTKQNKSSEHQNLISFQSVSLVLVLNWFNLLCCGGVVVRFGLKSQIKIAVAVMELYN